MKYKTHYVISKDKVLCGVFFLLANSRNIISEVTCKRCRKIYDSAHKQNKNINWDNVKGVDEL